MDKILITGSAGFIGFHLAKSLLEDGYELLGIDNLNSYYNPKLKKDRLGILSKYNNFSFQNVDISDRKSITKPFNSFNPNKVVNLAAQAGVRYSIENPYSYINSNIVGFNNLIELCRHNNVDGFIYASSSSVYGGNTKMPFSVTDRVDNPISIYAATKKATESIAHSYSNLWKLPITMLRFFTVYGPWGRPDMAFFKFTKSITKGKPIDIYNNGNMYRDFTYIDDIVKGINSLMTVPPTNGKLVHKNDSLSPVAPFRIVNIGNSKKIKLLDFIDALETYIGKKAIRNYMPMQKGDVEATWANTDLLKKLTGYAPKTNIKKGIKNFVDWYVSYYKTDK